MENLKHFFIISSPSPFHSVVLLQAIVCIYISAAARATGCLQEVSSFPFAHKKKFSHLTYRAQPNPNQASPAQPSPARLHHHVAAAASQLFHMKTILLMRVFQELCSAAAPLKRENEMGKDNVNGFV